jgi:P-type E1-E2 ATPase
MVILAITAAAIYTNTMEQWYNLSRLRDMAGKTSEVILLTSKGEKEVPDDSLAPGDRFLVKEEMSMPCDAVIFQGRVVVDESMLTGESAPISKTPFDLLEKKGEDIDALKHSGHILFSGTKVRKVTPGAIAVVYRTGFRSAKGQLVASLLVTKEDSLGFFSDAMYVIVFMFFLASLLYLWASSFLKDLGASDSLLVIKWLDSITIAVPPGLTTCLIVATSIAVKRLASKSVFVSETSRVNWAGTIQVACFDKTGTLTTDELCFDGVTLPKNVPGYPENAAAICEELMATCNSLSIVNGAAVGDPLEIELYLASGWTLSEESGVMMATSASKKSIQGRLSTMLAASGDITPRSSNVSTEPDGQYEIVKHFEFSSDKLRAGTLLRRPSGALVYLVKGNAVFF